jgi:hypothetical protein
MVAGRAALRRIYADMLKSNPIMMTLDEMLARGLPKEIYNKYLEEAISTGLIPVPGKSIIGGKVVTIDDILKEEDVMREIKPGFKQDLSFYGIG